MSTINLKSPEIDHQYFDKSQTTPKAWVWANRINAVVRKAFPSLLVLEREEYKSRDKQIAAHQQEIKELKELTRVLSTNLGDQIHYFGEDIKNSDLVIMGEVIRQMNGTLDQNINFGQHREMEKIAVQYAIKTNRDLIEISTRLKYKVEFARSKGDQ